MNISEVIQQLLSSATDLEAVSVVDPDIKRNNGDIEYLLAAARKSIVDNLRSDFAFTAANAVIDLMWEECNTGHWSSVSDTPKNIYAYASYLKVILCLMKAAIRFEGQNELLQEAVRTADFGLMIGKGYEEQLSRAATLLSTLIISGRESDAAIDSTIEPPANLDVNDKPPLESINLLPLVRLHCPSIDYFYSNHFTPRFPAVLTGCMDQWPALRLWKDLNYLVQVAGPRTVPIEIGSSYTENEWGVELTSIDDYIRQHILSTAPKVGYLAQHQLFDQIPELRKDIFIPDYCCSSDSDNEDFNVNINAWFGPANTLSPLHHDPKHNLLCQVVGVKQILLFSPKDSEFLYPHDESMLNNTAKVDPYNPDFDRFPNFKNATAYFCTIRPGEMIYIPPKWWHHVKSLEVSFSVSFWWD